MGRQLLLVLLLILGTFAAARAQSEQNIADTLPLKVAPSHMIAGAWQPLELEPIPGPGQPDSPLAPPPTDTCSMSPNLQLEPADGGAVVTNSMTESATDPVLSCMWGDPPSPRGFRTVWYRFTPPTSGWVTIETNGSTYDTVLAVYEGTCEDLEQLVCDDDSSGFASSITMSVLAGRTYYVEVADWHIGASGDAVVNISAWIEVDTNWQIIGNMDVPRSRHATVIQAEKIYAIGGQTTVSGNPVRTSTVSVYSTGTQSWTPLASLLGPDGLGYSNTDAALIGDRIYVPSGYVGHDTLYDGTHWVYEIISDTWSTEVLPNNWADGKPAIYEQAVAYSGPTLPDGYFVVGGLTGPLPLPPTSPPAAFQARDEMYYYIPQFNNWFVRQPMNTGRFGHTAALQRIGNDDYLCVVGGIGRNQEGNPVLITNGECYNITTSEQWDVITPPLNYPRYFAGSSIDPVGNWYVYGGTDKDGNSVGVTERYDPGSNSWIPLDVRYNLGIGLLGDPARPPRSWPGGGFVAQHLWAVGGERDTASGGNVVNLVEALYLPWRKIHVPVLFNQDASGEPDSTFANARHLTVNQAALGHFISPDDVYDAYEFSLTGSGPIIIKLRNIPEGTDLDVFAYTDNKLLLGSSTNIGNQNENIHLTLGPGRYYVLVERAFPFPGTEPDPEPYIIKIER